MKETRVQDTPLPVTQREKPPVTEETVSLPENIRFRRILLHAFVWFWPYLLFFSSTSYMVMVSDPDPGTALVHLISCGVLAVLAVSFILVLFRWIGGYPAPRRFLISRRSGWTLGGLWFLCLCLLLTGSGEGAYEDDSERIEEIHKPSDAYELMNPFLDASEVRYRLTHLSEIQDNLASFQKDYGVLIWSKQEKGIWFSRLEGVSPITYSLKEGPLDTVEQAYVGCMFTVDGLDRGLAAFMLMLRALGVEQSAAEDLHDQLVTAFSKREFPISFRDHSVQVLAVMTDDLSGLVIAITADF